MTKKTKEIGRKIAEKLKSIKEKEKVLRTLKKEKEIRDIESNLNERIEKLKMERPTFMKKLGRGISTIGKNVERTFRSQLKKERQSSQDKNLVGLLNRI